MKDPTAEDVLANLRGIRRFANDAIREIKQELMRPKIEKRIAEERKRERARKKWIKAMKAGDPSWEPPNTLADLIAQNIDDDDDD